MRSKLCVRISKFTPFTVSSKKTCSKMPLCQPSCYGTIYLSFACNRSRSSLAFFAHVFHLNEANWNNSVRQGASQRVTSAKFHAISGLSFNLKLSVIRENRFFRPVRRSANDLFQWLSADNSWIIINVICNCDYLLRFHAAKGITQTHKHTPCSALEVVMLLHIFWFSSRTKVFYDSSMKSRQQHNQTT